MTPKELSIQKLIISTLSQFELPVNFSGVAVDIYPSFYDDIYCHITYLFKNPFTGEDSELISRINATAIVPTIKKFFTGNDITKNISSSSSTIDNYNESKWWYEEQKLK
jgi:hypothetical protein